MFPVNVTQSQEPIWDFQVYSRFSKGWPIWVVETCDELRSFTKLRSFWDTCFVSTDLWMYPSQMAAKKWSPESIRHEKRGPRLSTNTRGGCSEIQDILLGASSSPCSRSLQATPHVVRKTAVENASYLCKSHFVDTISSLAHASLTPAHQYQAFRLKPCDLWVKDGGGGSLKKMVWHQKWVPLYKNSAGWVPLGNWIRKIHTTSYSA